MHRRDTYGQVPDIVRTAVAYFSILGSSLQYARWLSEEVAADRLRFRDATPERLAGYDAVVICSGTFGGWMPLAGFLKKRWPVLRTKRVIAVAIGSVPPEAPASRKALDSIPEEIKGSIAFFKLPCHSGLKLWLTGPFSAYQLSKHARSRDWIPSREKLAPVVAALRAP
jgi:hypothetical protein